MALMHIKVGHQNEALQRQIDLVKERHIFCKHMSAPGSDFSMSDKVFIDGREATIIMDLRPGHEFVKVRWQAEEGTVMKEDEVIRVNRLKICAEADDVAAKTLAAAESVADTEHSDREAALAAAQKAVHGMKEQVLKLISDFIILSFPIDDEAAKEYCSAIGSPDLLAAELYCNGQIDEVRQWARIVAATKKLAANEVEDKKRSLRQTLSSLVMSIEDIRDGLCPHALDCGNICCIKAFDKSVAEATEQVEEMTGRVAGAKIALEEFEALEPGMTEAEQDAYTATPEGAAALKAYQDAMTAVAYTEKVVEADVEEPALKKQRTAAAGA